MEAGYFDRRWRLDRAITVGRRAALWTVVGNAAGLLVQSLLLSLIHI